MVTIKLIIIVILLIIVGIWEISLTFSDLGPNETTLERVGEGVIVLFITGMIIGFLYPKRWYLGGLAAWSLVFGGIYLLIFGPSVPMQIPEGSQVLRIKISEGKLESNPYLLHEGGFYIECINNGMEEHEIALYKYPKKDTITERSEIAPSELSNNRMLASLKPLTSGEKNVSMFGGNYFSSGLYIIVCLNIKEDGTSHLSDNEFSIFEIE